MNSLLIIINGVSALLLLLMAVILFAATKFKGVYSYITLIVLATTLPAQAYNLCVRLGELHAADFLTMPAYASNVLLMPLLYLFLRKELDVTYRFTRRTLWHFAASFCNLACCVVYFLITPLPTRLANLPLYLQDGLPWPFLLNMTTVYSQVAIYFFLIFRFLHRNRKALYTNHSDSEYLTIRWVGRLMWLCCGEFGIIFLANLLSESSEVWVIPVCNVIMMSYLVYNSIVHPTEGVIHPMPIEVPPKAAQDRRRLTTCAMEGYCRSVTTYLQESQAYKDTGLSLRQISDATGISESNISESINRFLGKNFFDLVNGLRINHAKQLLSDPNSPFTIEGIAIESGFRSRSTFYIAFNKFEKTTPGTWAAAQRKKSV